MVREGLSAPATPVQMIASTLKREIRSCEHMAAFVLPIPDLTMTSSTPFAPPRWNVSVAPFSFLETRKCLRYAATSSSIAARMPTFISCEEGCPLINIASRIQENCLSSFRPPALLLLHALALPFPAHLPLLLPPS